MKVITTQETLIAIEITKDLTKKWSINRLAKAIGKHYKPTYESVQRLIKENYLELNQNKLLQPLFHKTSLFEYAEKMRSQKLRKDLLIIKEKLSKISPFFSAVLFGSSVNKKGNDIDLLIIIPNSEKIESFKKQIQKALGSFKTDLNFINENSCYEMLNMPNQFNVMNEIMKNHLVLQGYENFYGIIKRWKYAE